MLGGAIVSLTWLYLLATTTLLGAELNAVLSDRRSAAGAVAPRGGTSGGAPAPVPAAVGAGVLAAALLLGRRRR